MIRNIFDLITGIATLMLGGIAIADFTDMEINLNNVISLASCVLGIAVTGIAIFILLVDIYETKEVKKDDKD